MRYIKFSLVILFLGLLGKVSAQITFFEGTFEEAVEKAKKEKKELFVDFYADWCQPCKLMASQVFTLPEVGEYFNKNFLSLKINVEALENKTIVQKYKVNVLPTLLFINGKGEVVRTINGTINSEALLHEAKVVCGEALSFEKLYEKIRKEKKNLDLCQELLLQAPAFIGTQEGYNREKWIVRIESLFDDYVNTKKLENMANEEDFPLLVMVKLRLTGASVRLILCRSMAVSSVSITGASSRSLAESFEKSSPMMATVSIFMRSAEFLSGAMVIESVSTPQVLTRSPWNTVEITNLSPGGTSAGCMITLIYDGLLMICGRIVSAEAL